MKNEKKTSKKKEKKNLEKGVKNEKRRVIETKKSLFHCYASKKELY